MDVEVDEEVVDILPGLMKPRPSTIRYDTVVDVLRQPEHGEHCTDDEHRLDDVGSIYSPSRTYLLTC